MAKAKKTSKTAPKKKAAKAKAKPAPKKAAKATKAKAAGKRAPAPQRASSPAVVHWEIQARDLEGQQQFFATLFGWRIDTNNPMSYGMISGAGKDTIGGGIGPAPDSAARVTFYVQVPDINALLDKAHTLGAQTVVPRTEFGGVIMGLFKDPEGNVIGLVED